ncbi:hypothetical protein ES705_33629 [subsurface metagenome]
MDRIKIEMICVIIVFMIWSFIFGIYIDTLFSNCFSSDFLSLTILMIICSVGFVLMVFIEFPKLLKELKD